MDSRNYLTLVLLLLSVFASTWLLKRWHAASQLPFPPGPKPKFITGNLKDVPTVQPWLTYTDWGKQYGEVVHVRVFGQHVVIVNSLNAAVELFDRRARIYSDRPWLPMVDLTGWDYNMSFMPHGDKWRQYRRMFHQHFRRDAIVAYRPIQMRKIYDMLRNLLASPEHFFEHVKTLAAAIVMAVTYGYDVKPTNDRFVDLAEDGVKRICEAVFPGAFAVNSLPFLRHLPAWFPGCGFHKYGQDTLKLIKEMQDAPFEFVRQNMRDGVGSLCLLAELLESNDAQGGSKSQEKVIKEIAATSYAGGSDTTTSSMLTLFLALAMHPDVQRKAQNEIDTVVGSARLPEFEDRPSLPHVEAVYREIMRWRPVAPLGVAHAATEDDIYNGYFIPKGTTVLSNIWAIVHDESIYPEADKFNPERFLDVDGQLNGSDNILTFGFGRRACVGRHVADATVWAAVVSVLSTFNIATAKDATGKDIDIDPAYSDGLVSHPLPFKCSITPRSDVAKKLVEEMF
ncbi:cytochrome P450 [Mycena sp. CBHHK59/15]|nr:cytochrome P450 [Mycena sp. CBHHK59/15]